MASLFEQLKEAGRKKRTLEINGVKVTVRSITAAESESTLIFSKGLKPPAVIDPKTGRKTGDDYYDPDYLEASRKARELGNIALILLGCPELAEDLGNQGYGPIELKAEMIQKTFTPGTIQALVNTIIELSDGISISKDAENLFLEDSPDSPNSKSSENGRQTQETEKSPQDSPVPIKNTKKSKSGDSTTTPGVSGKPSQTT